MTRRSKAAPVVNRLLQRSPPKERARFIARCEPVHLLFGEVLAEPGARLPHVHFPTGGFISLITPLDEPEAIEVALVGCEGVHGVPLVLGAALSQMRAEVQGAGASLRMEAAAFQSGLDGFPVLRSSIELYIHVLMEQLARTAGCNRFHVVEQRVARWLLMTSDRARARTFAMTQEFLARMLGVRRVGVTEAASALQARGLIGYTRGVVTIVDRAGLERASCGCYRSDRETYARFL